MSMHRVARLLLDAGIAETVSSPVDGEVRMAPRYRELEALRASAERFRAFNELVQRGELLIALRRHPLVALGILRRSVLSAFGRPRTRDAAVSSSADLQANSNPEGHVLGPAGDMASLDEHEARAADRGVRLDELDEVQLCADRQSDDAESHADAERDGAAVDDPFDEVIRGITESVALRQLESAVMHTRERDHYRPSYLDDEPYLRLRMRDIGFAIADENDPEFDPGQRASVHLLVHRSGVIQLLIACRLPAGVTTSGVLGCLRSNSIALKWSEMAEPILRPMVRRANARSRWRPWTGPAMKLLGHWLDETAEGTRWRRFEGSGETLSDAFGVYLEAIEDVVGSRVSGTSWMSYPSVFLQPRCCKGEAAFRSAHARELTAILVNYREVDLLRDAERVNLPEDTSILNDHSAWFTSAQMTHIDWFDHEKLSRFDNHLHSLIIVENFLLQMWQIQSLATDIEHAGRARVSPRTTQRSLIHGLTEFYDSQLSFGTANDIVNTLRSESGVDRLHDHLVDRVDQLGSLTAAQRAEEAATRSGFVGLAAIAATALLALPAITQTLNAVSALPATGWKGTTSAPLRWLADYGSTGAWAAYLVVIFTLITLWCSISLRLRRQRGRDVRRKRGPRSAGVAWPDGTISVERVK